MNTYKTQGFILSRRNLGEADKLITLFTRNFGKRVVLAKGIRRLISRRAAHLEIFTLADLTLHKGKTLDNISEAVTLESYAFLRTRLERVGFAYTGLEIVARLTAENQESEILFTHMQHFLRSLNDPEVERQRARAELIYFKTAVLSDLGFIEKDRRFNEKYLDQVLENVLERTLYGQIWLTKIRQSLYN